MGVTASVEVLAMSSPSSSADDSSRRSQKVPADKAKHLHDTTKEIKDVFDDLVPLSKQDSESSDLSSDGSTNFVLPRQATCLKGRWMNHIDSFSSQDELLLASEVVSEVTASEPPRDSSISVKIMIPELNKSAPK